jgi:hypothetical protein
MELKTFDAIFATVPVVITNVIIVPNAVLTVVNVDYHGDFVSMVTRT